ncbi:hypothetical protein JCM9279_001706, partial [Rhodotorula babjevae]
MGAVPLSRPRRDGRPAHAWWSAKISALHQDARRKERRAHQPRSADDAAAAALEAKVAKSRLKDKLALLQPILLPKVEPAAAATAAARAVEAEVAEVEVEAEVEFEWPTLQEHEVRSVLLGARPYAAVGPNGIPNVVLQAAWDVLAPHLVPLYAALLALGHLPASWRDGTGVVLRKPKKPDYSETRAYRLIAFGRCVSKLL